MVGYAKNAPKDEEWLREKIAEPVCKLCGQTEELECNISEGGCVELAECLEQIIAKMKEAGWVSPADQKEALSRELAAGYRLGRNKSKVTLEVNND